LRIRGGVGISGLTMEHRFCARTGILSYCSVQ
jgi:hypothetical protein